MKETVKKMLAIWLVSLSAAALADAGNLCIVFSTEPTDCYLDGTPAANGEYYALCWSESETFGGIKADGTPAADGDRVLIMAPLATGGADSHCPRIFFQVDSADVPSKAGFYSVYLMDTRVSEQTLAGDADGDGVPDVINGINLAASVASSAGDKVTLGAAATSAAAFAETEVPAEGAAPAIAGFTLSGGYACITVINMSPSVRYNVRTGATLDALKSSEVSLGASPQTGAGSEPVEFIVPADEANFFQVVRQPLATPSND